MHTLSNLPSSQRDVSLLLGLGCAGFSANGLTPLLLAYSAGTLGYLSCNWFGTAYDHYPTVYVTFGAYKAVVI
jgi:hypothetical protein